MTRSAHSVARLVTLGVFLLPALVNGDANDVAINEILYHHYRSNEGGEFLEIANHGATAVDLNGWRVEVGVSFAFPAGTNLGPAGFILLADDATVAAAIYGVEIFGSFNNDGRLSNSGETIRLVDAVGNVIDLVTYEDQSPWPREADGGGPSLELRDPTRGHDDAANWGFGQLYSPGAPNRPTGAGGAVGGVVINEILYRPRRTEERENLDRVNAGFYTEEGDDLFGEYVEILNRRPRRLTLPVGCSAEASSSSSIGYF